jgi:iron(II)-dependent oxidoreductase
VDNWVRQGSLPPAQAEGLREDLNREDDELRKEWERFETAKRDSSGRVVHPWLWDVPQYTVENQPVIGVSWYEACAYAAWLTDVLRKRGAISEQDTIRLPTEAEWEKAARGNTGRLWTWGNIWRSSLANSLQGRVMQPSAVGAYPRNKSPYGVEDMIGNVWEWCLDWYDENAYRNRRDGVKDPRGPETGMSRVLRGGSWNNNRDAARCSCRDRSAPDLFNDSFGFRLVCSPSSPSLRSESLNSESLSREEPIHE